MKVTFAIALGWTLAVLVGAATHSANLPIAFVCGAVAGVLPFVAQISVVKAEQELTSRSLCYLGASAAMVRSEAGIAAEREHLHTAKVMLAAWTLARGVSVWVTAAVPLMVLWRLGGSE